MVTLYLLPSMMTNLQSKIYQELKPGTRVCPHDYHFGERLEPGRYITFDGAGEREVNGVPRATIYLWIVPAKIRANWQPGSRCGRRPVRSHLKQRVSDHRGRRARCRQVRETGTGRVARGRHPLCIQLRGRPAPVPRPRGGRQHAGHGGSRQRQGRGALDGKAPVGATASGRHIARKARWLVASSRSCDDRSCERGPRPTMHGR